MPIEKRGNNNRERSENNAPKSDDACSGKLNVENRPPNVALSPIKRHLAKPDSAPKRTVIPFDVRKHPGNRDSRDSKPLNVRKTANPGSAPKRSLNAPNNNRATVMLERRATTTNKAEEDWSRDPVRI